MKKTKLAPHTQKLGRPFLWRCTSCKKIVESAAPEKCCGSRTRQLAPVSEPSKIWFENFADTASLVFIPPSEIIPLTGVVSDREINQLALAAGRDLEKILVGKEIKCPRYFEVYNGKTKHVRVSDLKTKKSFVSALSSAVKHRKRDLPAKKTAPFGNLIELGHVMDEFFEGIMADIESENWGEGERVNFYSEQIELTVTGSPDLSFRGIPVEMKTTKLLPTEEMGKRDRSNFKQKWKSNYLSQIAMYSHASSKDWMLIFLISRQTGEFTVLPVDGREKLARLQKDWSKWVKDGRVRQLLAKYS